MRLRRRLLVTLAATATAAACRGSGPTAGDTPSDGSSPGDASAPTLLQALPRSLTVSERNAAAASGDFSFALFREVNRRKANANVFISPLSASVALAMAAQGSAGATELAMRRTLGFPDATLDAMGAGYHGLLALLVGLDPSVTVKSANAIWYRNGLPVQPSFVSATQQSFGATVSAANFDDVAGTLNQVNGWAKTQTNGKIDQVLQDVRKDDLMFLLNALYFKGSWRDRFDAAATTPASFRSSNGTTSQVPTMHRQATMRWTRGDGFQAVDLPYGNGAFSMTVLLPDSAHTADALATSLDATAWNALVAALHDTPVQLALPKFTVTYDDEWKDVLTTLGMGPAFSDAADFSRMVVGGGVKIDFVRQKAYVDVNEEGTEAAAVTTIGIVPTSAPVTQVMRVDRPFVFAVREHLTGAVLFVGKVDQL